MQFVEPLSMQEREPTDPVSAALSAMMDGDATAADEACRAWRGDASVRDRWHTYHLIGDLLRSDEHRCEPARDALFVGRLRERLAQEPVVLAPQPVRAAVRTRRLRAWMTPAAVAAGFVAVAGALVVTRTGSGDSDAERLARAGAAPASAATAGAALSTTAALPEGVTLVRDADLDRYLAAHRQYANTSTVVAPGGAVRSVSVAAPGR